ncbi:DHH family phosphoesterase [Haloparvum sp. PAK95]|uniref:DHH family phosphoesterase n=1 Tax=Haloparvum sp. PAK95 TaxID=3418962 RepID=UPI003D2ECA9F
MDDDLIDDDLIPLSRRSKLPGKGFFYPDSLDEERAEQRAKETIEGAETVVIADGDADGLACAAMIREYYGAELDVAAFEAAIEDRVPETGPGDVPEAETVEEVAAEAAEAAEALESEGDEAEDGDDGDDAEDPTEDAHTRSSVALVSAGPYSLDDAFERVLAYGEPDLDLYVCDLCPDEYAWIGDELEALAEQAAAIRWFDHHQWDDAAAAAVREAGVDLVVGESDEECTADVTLRSLEYDFDEQWAELAAVTRDHDLWLKEDPRSDDLADYAHWSGAEEYVTVVGAYGADLPDSVGDFLAHRRVEKENRIEAAVGRATFQAVGDWSVAVTYGRCSQNEVAERLRKQGADAAVIVKPAGSASIRGSEDFQRAHEVAGKVNGGGHPQAAGCKPDIYDDMLDYAQHWTTEGQATRKVILSAFEEVAEEAAAEAEAEEAEAAEAEAAEAEAEDTE